MSTPGAAGIAERLRERADRSGVETSYRLQRGLDRHAITVFDVARRRRPVIANNRVAIFTRREHVLEVLEDNEHFTVGLYAPKMAAFAGPVTGGQNDEAYYFKADAILKGAIRPEDLARIAAIATDTSEQLLEQAAPHGHIDVVGLADTVIHRLIADYFGTPGPTEETLLGWARALFEEIFLNLQNAQTPRVAAEAAAAQFRAYLDGLIAARKAMETVDEGPDDFLGRLLDLQETEEPSLTDGDLRHNLIRLLSAWVPTTSKVMALAIEELFRRPVELAGAQRAARDDDDGLVAAYLFEALRFRPPTIFLARRCLADATVAQGTPYETRVREGAFVVVASQSAMMDERFVKDPHVFRTDRPRSDYLLFGHQPHVCFGEAINRVQIPMMGKALLRRSGFQRAPGPPGRLRWSGPYPSGLAVAYR